MAKLERKKFKVFGENAPLDEIGQFGSAKATTKKNTKDIEEIQELEAWSEGWGGAVISNKNYPPMEEMTGAMNVMSYQIAYTLQEGIPEWNKDTTYYKGSIVKNLEGEDVKLYQSISNDNLNNPLSNTDNWSEISFGGSGLEVCDIGMALYVDETKGLRRYLNGQIVDINANTQAFLNRLLQIKTTNPDYFTTEDNWQAEATLNIDGCVYKFVLNYADDGETVVSVRLPKYPDYVEVSAGSNITTAPVSGFVQSKVASGTVLLPNANLNPNWDGSYALTSNGKYKHCNLFAQDGSGNVTVRDIGNGSVYYVDAQADLSNLKLKNTKLKLYYFIQIATGAETENNIVNDIELNNPYSLFDSKYSDHELNNLSWLKSEGQWNSKTVYPDAYNKILENVNKSTKGFLGQTMYMWGSASGGYMTTSLTPVVGSVVYSYGSKKLVGYITEVDLTIPAVSIRDDVGGVSYTNVGRYTPSDESSSAYITDYDFVLNTAEETFRLPLLDGSEDLLSDRYDDLELKASGSTYTAPANGWFAIAANNGGANYAIAMDCNGVIFHNRTAQAGNGTAVSCPATKGSVMTMNYDGLQSVAYFRFIYSKGNGSLYYYVGETVQNANLINAGRIGEVLPTKTDKVQAAQASMPSSKYIDLTLGASGSTYTAPANGWIFFSKVSGASNKFIEVSSGTNRGSSTLFSTGSNDTLKLLVPVAKGVTFFAKYNATGATNYFRFIYAEGSKED